MGNARILSRLAAKRQGKEALGQANPHHQVTNAGMLGVHPQAQQAHLDSPLYLLLES